MIRLAIKVLPILILLSLGACSSTPIAVPPDYPLVSPRETTRYLQWAWNTAPPDERPKHVYNCLSDEFIQRHKITLSDVEYFWSEVRDEIERYIGDPAGVRVLEEREIDPRRRELDLRNGERAATVLFVLQTTYEIIPTRRGRESISGTMSALDRVWRYENGAAHIYLPDVDPPIAPSEVYQVMIENAWKVDAIVKHNLGELEKELGRKSPTNPR